MDDKLHGRERTRKTHPKAMSRGLFPVGSQQNLNQKDLEIKVYVCCLENTEVTRESGKNWRNLSSGSVSETEKDGAEDSCFSLEA